MAEVCVHVCVCGGGGGGGGLISSHSQRQDFLLASDFL